MKRFLCLSIGMVMLFCSAAVFADTSVSTNTVGYDAADGGNISSEQLKSLLNIIKGKIEVPSEFTKMDYDIYSEDNIFDSTVYVTWTADEDENNDYVSVTANFNGDILSYSCSNSGEDESNRKLQILTKDEARQAADNFVKKAAGDDFSSYKRTDKASSFLNGYKFVYERYFDGIPVKNSTLSITVNMSDGSVESYRSNVNYAMLPTLKSENNTINKDNAKRAYLDGIGVDIMYNYVRDDESGNVTAIPVYKIPSGKKYVDAVTGDIIESDRDYDFRAYAFDTMPDEAAESEEAAAAGYDNLTESEIVQADEVSNLYSIDKAVSNLREAFPTIKNKKVTGYKLLNIYDAYMRNKGKNQEKEYYYSINFEEANAYVNAVSGEILNFASYAKAENKNTLNNEEDVRLKAKELIDKIAGPVTGEIKDGDVIIRDYGGSSVTYKRFHNDIVCNHDSIYVGFNKAGDVEDYSKEWTKADFKSSDNIISDSKAFDVFDSDKNYSLCYTEHNGAYKLVYSFTKNVSYPYVEAVSGEKLGYDGKPYTEITQDDYTDIDNHWCKEAAQALAALGMRFEGNEFKPEQPMTKGDFYDFMDLSDDLEQTERDEPFTKYDAVQYAADMLEIKYVTDNNDIFVQPFKDVDSDNTGAVAVLKSLGVIKGENGLFNGDKVITRAEFVTIIYGLFNNSQVFKW